MYVSFSFLPAGIVGMIGRINLQSNKVIRVNYEQDGCQPLPPPHTHRLDYNWYNRLPLNWFLFKGAFHPLPLTHIHELFIQSQNMKSTIT